MMNIAQAFDAAKNALVLFKMKYAVHKFLSYLLVLLCFGHSASASGGLTLHSFFGSQISLAKDSLRYARKGNVYFTGGLLFLKQSYKDYIVSPNIYTSTNVRPLLSIGLEKKYQDYSGFTNLLVGSQKLNDVPGSFYGDARTNLLTVKLNTSRTWQLAEMIHQRVDWKLGYIVNAEYTHRVNEKFGNAAYMYDIWLNAGVANRLEFPFIIKTENKFLFFHFRQPEQHFQLNWQVNLPVLGIITRPNYSGFGNFASGGSVNVILEEMINNVEFVSMNKFIMVQSQIELLAPLGNNNRLRVAYQWQGFRYNNELARLQGAWGGIQIGVLFKIDSREVVGN